MPSLSRRSPSLPLSHSSLSQAKAFIKDDIKLNFDEDTYTAALDTITATTKVRPCV